MNDWIKDSNHIGEGWQHPVSHCSVDRCGLQPPAPDYNYGAHPGPYAVPPTPRPTKKKHRGAKVFAVVAVLVVAGVASCVAAVDNAAQEFAGDLPNTVPDTATAAPTPGSAAQTKTPAPKPSPRTKEAKPAFLPQDGTLLVGPDVKPGTYQATAPEMVPGMGTSNCYWARLRSTDGGVGSIIANELTTTVGGKVTLTIKPTDEAVKISGCGTWKRVQR